MSDNTDDQAMPDGDRAAANRLLLRIALQGRGWATALLLSSLAIAAAETALPAVLGRAVDAVLGHGRATEWLSVAGAVVTVLVLGDALDDLAAGMSTARATRWLRRTVLDHLLTLGPRARRFDPGDLAARLVGNAADAGRTATVLVWALSAVIPALGGVIALALIDPWLCLTFLVGAPALLAIVKVTVRDASELAENYLRVQGRIAGLFVAALSGARTIAAAGTVETERRRVLAPLPELREHGIGMWRVQTRLAAQEAVLVPLLEIAVLAVAGVELARGRITPGELLAASQYVALAAGLGSAIGSVSRLAQARAAAGRSAEVLDEAAVEYGSRELPEGTGQLELRGVSVRTEDGRGLERISLVVPGGALVAVVGRSGSGKSLLAAVAGRLVEPEEGEVLLDGVPLRELDRGALRQAVAYAFERPALIGETLSDAIALGMTDPTSDGVTAAARAACADDFIRRMPDQYATALSSAPMSGGEAQRLGLARAFAQGGRVLVLDDIAASLDTVTEFRIRQVLTGPLGDRTRLVVARRASTAAIADLVVWLEAGQVCAVGAHRRLWDDPRYRAVFEPAGSSDRRRTKVSA